MQLGLVDGVVTEDSDAFLFGARTVYKNIFSDKKFVEVCILTLSYMTMLVGLMDSDDDNDDDDDDCDDDDSDDDDDACRSDG